MPALELDNGQILTEGPAIVQYLADQKPDSGLAPKAGSFERYRLQEWLNFLTSEVHKQFSPLFKPNTPEDYKPIAKENLAGRFDWLDKQLAGKDYLMGKQFTVADAYLFVLLGWTARRRSTSRSGRTSPRSTSASARGRKCRKRCRPKAC